MCLGRKGYIADDVKAMTGKDVRIYSMQSNIATPGSSALIAEALRHTLTEDTGYVPQKLGPKIQSGGGDDRGAE
jgi:hypothetical protein